MNTIRFQHAEKPRTESYRVDFYTPGGTVPVHSFETPAAQTLNANAGTNPATYEIAAAVVTANKPAPGTYQMTVTARNSTAAPGISERVAVTEADPSIAAPFNVTVTT